MKHNDYLLTGILVVTSSTIEPIETTATVLQQQTVEISTGILA